MKTSWVEGGEKGGDPYKLPSTCAVSRLDLLFWMDAFLPYILSYLLLLPTYLLLLLISLVGTKTRR